MSAITEDAIPKIKPSIKIVKSMKNYGCRTSEAGPAICLKDERKKNPDSVRLLIPVERTISIAFA